MLIRDASAADWPAIWRFMHRIVAAGETFTWPRDISGERARGMWMHEPPGRTVVAVGADGAVAGTAETHPNQGGSLGFEVLATVPEAFCHPVKGYVGLHIMYRRL